MHTFTDMAAADDGNPANAGAPELNMTTITLSHRHHTYTFEFPENATVEDLFHEIEQTLEIPAANQKIIIPKSPLLQYPPKEPTRPLRELEGKKLMLMGSGAAMVNAVQSMCQKIKQRNAARAAQMAQRRASAHPRKSATTVETRYTFHRVEPLRNLPGPERSMAMLMRLKADPGIVSAMRKHKFSVGLLTEMEPLAHTQSSHEGTSRTLGLNRNQGEAIELRLRTDAYDGYRDYKTIRNTLCHELAHNVHGPHDRNFWDLCHQIEREVQAGDWKTGGRTIGETSRYHISGQDVDDEDVHEDEGGWTGGEFVLGGTKGGTTGSDGGMSRREILAQAAMERQRRDIESERKADKGWRPCQRPHRGDEAQ